MNYRLLTPEQKLTNKKGRDQRRNIARRLKRRQALHAGNDFLVALHAYVGMINPDQNFDYLYGHGKKAQKVVDQIAAMPPLDAWWPPPQLPSIPDAEVISVPIPSRILQKSRRGLPLCRFTNPPIIIWSPPESQDDLLAFVRRPDVVQWFRGACRYRFQQAGSLLFDYLEPGRCACYLHDRGLISRPLTQEEVEAVERATSFDKYYQEYRERFATMTPQYKFAQAWGDWAAAWYSDIDEFVNDIRIPLRLHRQLYLLNLIRGAFGEPEFLDFYSLNYHPLFGCPFNKIYDYRPNHVHPTHAHPTELALVHSSLSDQTLIGNR